MNNTIFLIVAPSGAGKTTLITELEKQFGLKSIQSYTTRLPRYENEVGHTFVSKDFFNTIRQNLVAYTLYNGFEYGVTSQQIDDSDLYVVDPKGVEFFKNNYIGDKQYKIIYLDSDIATRIKRMEDRFSKDNNIDILNYIEMLPKIRENFDVIMTRIKNDIIDFSGMKQKSDICILNNEDTNIQDVVNKVIEYINTTNSEG